MKITFIRHSKTNRFAEIPIKQWALSPEGVTFANSLADLDAIKKLDVIYSSLQTKALETAVIIAKPNAIPIKTNDDLTEVSSFTGPFEPDFDLYTKNVHDFYFDEIERIGAGESKKEAVERFNNALEEIVKENPDKNDIGIISHGNILTLFSSQYKEVDCYSLHKTMRQPDIAVFDWGNKKFDLFFGDEIK